MGTEAAASTTRTAAPPAGTRVARTGETVRVPARPTRAELERRVLAQIYEAPTTIQEAAREDAEQVAAARPREVPTLVSFAEDVIERRFDKGLSDGAMGVYRAALRAWKDYFGRRHGRAAVRLDQITPSMWLDYRAWGASARNSLGGPAKPISPRTINADHAAMCRILNESVLDGHLDKNPIAGMKKLREVRRQRRYLTKEELGTLIAKCPQHFRPFVVTAAYTGARKDDLTRLRWSDLDDGPRLRRRGPAGAHAMRRRRVTLGRIRAIT